MKYSSAGILTVLFSFLVLQLSSQAVGIRADNTSPDASSMLDIKSTTKGLLIPRMTSGQRSGIPAPAVGLMVYDTDTQSFWYRSSGGWLNMSSPVKASAYIYNTNFQYCTIENDITFSDNGPLTGITHSPGSAAIQIVTGGLYKIFFSVTAYEPNQFAIFINGVQVPGSLYGSAAGTDQNKGMLILNINAGDIVTLRNHTSYSDIGLNPMAGGVQTNVNASILIEQL